MHAFSPACAAVLVASAILATSANGRAQLHWDAGFQAGAMERVQAGGASPVPGPMGEIHGHLAVVPMLRLGPYATYDVSPYAPSEHAPARQIVEGGLRAKVSPPLLSGSWHLWGVVGLGYAYAMGSSHVTGAESSGAISGTFLDLPVGIGVGYRIRGPRDPWELTAELGARVGVAFFGALYSDAPRDSFALGLSVGVSLQE